MRVFVFCGPTISQLEAKSFLDATYLPPVTQGDVLKLNRQEVDVIGIIDGYFQMEPSVWHKELLYALHQGVHVFGCSSMGALRASELHHFGVKGVGKIFEHFRDGKLIRDDEVALNHGPAEIGYANLSEPLVNIRFSLEKAVDNGVISTTLSQTLLSLIGAEFYPNRSYEKMIALGVQNGQCENELRSLLTWLQVERVDQKKTDAIEMLTTIREFVQSDPKPFRPRFHLERTSIFDQL